MYNTMKVKPQGTISQKRVVVDYRTYKSTENELS